MGNLLPQSAIYFVNQVTPQRHPHLDDRIILKAPLSSLNIIEATETVPTLPKLQPNSLIEPIILTVIAYSLISGKSHQERNPSLDSKVNSSVAYIRA